MDSYCTIDIIKNNNRHKCIAYGSNTAALCSIIEHITERQSGEKLNQILSLLSIVSQRVGVVIER